MNSKDVIRAVMAIDEARSAVRPLVGDMPMGFDSADEIYIAAMEQMGRDCDDIREFPSVAKAIWPVFSRHHQGLSARHPIAMDAKSSAARSTMFPNANRLGYSH